MKKCLTIKKTENIIPKGMIKTKTIINNFCLEKSK